MKPYLVLLLCLGLPLKGLAEVRIFACEPEWAALGQHIGGDLATVTQATQALQDPHHIQARPSLIARMRRADLVLCTGAGLETGWLPLLLRRANNPQVQPGQPGYLEAASVVPLREKPQRLDRAQGDIHAAGNPHIQTDPRNILRVAEALADRLALIDPAHAGTYQQHLADFTTRWQQAMADWQRQAAPLQGMPVVVQHNSWVYLAHWLGLEQVATIESKPGVPPSGADLARLQQILQQRPARAIIRAAYQDPRAADWLAEHTGLPVVVLPFTVGGDEQAGDLFALFDDTLQRLLAVAP